MRTAHEARIKSYEDAGQTIIYLDESGFAVDMPRTHGYSPKGTRCEGVYDWHKKGRINALGAVVQGLLLTVTLITGMVNTDVFYAWLTQDLLPKIPANSVIVMDNATFHRREDIYQAIQAAGATLEFLPPYSPDLNPIEKKWAQAKAIRRQHDCSVDELFRNHMEYINL